MPIKIKDLYHFLLPKFQNLFLEYKVDFKPRYGHVKPPHKGLYKIIDAHRKAYADFLKASLKYSARIQEIKNMGEERDEKLPPGTMAFFPALISWASTPCWPKTSQRNTWRSAPEIPRKWHRKP